jgi:hypothetical protein
MGNRSTIPLPDQSQLQRVFATREFRRRKLINTDEGRHPGKWGGCFGRRPDGWSVRTGNTRPSAWDGAGYITKRLVRLNRWPPSWTSPFSGMEMAGRGFALPWTLQQRAPAVGRCIPWDGQRRQLSEQDTVANVGSSWSRSRFLSSIPTRPAHWVECRKDFSLLLRRGFLPPAATIWSRRSLSALRLRDMCRAGTAKRARLQVGHVQILLSRLTHPKATSKQLARKRMGAYSRQRLSLFPRRGRSAAPHVDASQRENHDANTSIVYVSGPSRGAVKPK